ncbi:MAG: sigma-70 family RNA polymerase sigma factor [Planctomycetes bacterium]|nr:sigma-70 family RNA polymerase sigma factor [Planctomycetota bacterium]
MSLDRATLIAQYLERLGTGDRAVLDDLLPHVYEELRAMAARILKAGGPPTLQPTLLVHEAYMRLAEHEGRGFESPKHFLDVASLAMRQLLASYARRRNAIKRGGDRERTPLENAEAALLESVAEADDLVALDEALEELRRLDPRHARIVELRFLTGLSIEETADVLGVSERTVRRDWQMARAWLHRAIDERRKPGY